MSGLPTPKSQYEEGITVKRYASGSLVKGRFTEGSESTFTITASIQPAKMKDLMFLPEGKRSREHKVIFTETELKDVEDANNTSADRVVYEGVDWEVIRSRRFGTGSKLDHYHCLAVKVNP